MFFFRGDFWGSTSNDSIWADVWRSHYLTHQKTCPLQKGKPDSRRQGQGRGISSLKRILICDVHERKDSPECGPKQLRL